MRHVIKVLMTEFVTHDVKRFVFEKPAGLKYIPGQATLVALNQPGLDEDLHPFTPTSLPEDGVLQYMIKEYRDHHGMTEALHKFRPGDELVIKNVFGAIQYRGPGVFIAGGAGITPFIAILRHLRRTGRLEGNTLLFSNKTQADIIVERELRSCLGDKCLFTLTRESRPGYENRRMDGAYLREKIQRFDQPFYVCGPPSFIEELSQTLQALGAVADNVVFD